MAITGPFFATSLLLFSLLVIATANDYNYDSSKNQAYNYGTKPEGEEKPEYGTTPDLYKPQPEGKEKAGPVESEKPDYGRQPVYQAQPEKEEKREYGTTPDLYKPQPEGKEKPGPVESEKPDYGREPVYQRQPEKPGPVESEKPAYGTKQNFYKPQPEETKKPESEEEEKPDYSTKPDFYPPQPEENKKPELSQEVEKTDYSTKPDSYKPKSEEKEGSDYERKPYAATPKAEGEEADHYGSEVPDFYPLKPEILPIGVQGLVLCKSGPKYNPIQGALVRITCLAVDENGYQKTHSVCSGETDSKGYFLATLSPLGLDVDSQLKLTECRAFLESSPLETCNVPVDVNKGITGASLSDFRLLNQKRMKLYSVGPFFFTPKPNSVSNGY